MTALRSDHLCLFNHPDYHALNIGPGQEVLRFDHVEDERLVGSLVGVFDGTTFDSGYSAPFGGPDIVRDAESVGQIAALLDSATRAIVARGARLARIRTRPEFHADNGAAIVFALLNLGYTVERCELTLGLDLRGIADPEQYLARLKSPARRALKHGLDAAPEWCVAEDAAQWAEAYDLLQQNRAERGIQLKLSLDYMLAIRARFPTRIFMYLLKYAGRSAAAALVYRVTRQADYVVAWGDDRTARKLAPINVVAFRLVEDALARGVGAIDLGISSVSGVPDDGLIQFKRHIAASTGLRLDLIKRVET